MFIFIYHQYTYYAIILMTINTEIHQIYITIIILILPKIVLLTFLLCKMVLKPLYNYKIARQTHIFILL
jgi:hypothetical protein